MRQKFEARLSWWDEKLSATTNWLGHSNITHVGIRPKPTTASVWLHGWKHLANNRRVMTTSLSVRRVSRSNFWRFAADICNHAVFRWIRFVYYVSVNSPLTPPPPTPLPLPQDNHWSSRNELRSLFKLNDVLELKILLERYFMFYRVIIIIIFVVA